MSIYSGFALRKHETYYNQLLFKAIELISGRLLGLLKLHDSKLKVKRNNFNPNFIEDEGMESAHFGYLEESGMVIGSY